ncbi:MAG: CehA/McbA family metallohydrolase [Candidatus Marinimicrobia bacterium]|nr:CehA/McbA family metallohydrolase [Candidatus Neomarinimicrobiota bacterium]
MEILQKCSGVLLGLLLLQGCAQKSTWYRGNTHAHTVICGHADSSPQLVTQWYHDHGYNFLILSEHNHFINPDSVKMPVSLRDNFILIPGEEISGPKIIHSTAMNIEKLVLPDKGLEIKSHIIQNHVDITREAGGRSILNHPNYRYAVSQGDILPVNGLNMFELYNGHPLVANNGDGEHISTEALWDSLLTRGMPVFGVSSDDAHYFATIDSAHSNPGRGWVMVNASELTGDAIAQAMYHGSFYASNGVMLDYCSIKNGKYRVRVNVAQTMDELTSTELKGRLVEATEPGFTIEYIGHKGEVLFTTNNSRADFLISGVSHYVRPRISYFRDHPSGGSEAFFAWGQPEFTDGRKLQE